MNAKATIQKHISPIPKKALAWVALALSLVIIGIGVAQTCKIKFCDTPLDLQTVKSGQVVYADIIGFSPSYHSGARSYCFALDTNGNIFLTPAPGDDYPEYEAQRNYWNGQGDPVPVRFILSPKTLEAMHRQSVATDCGLSLEDYDRQFTPYCFGDPSGILWYIAGCILGICGLIWICVADLYQDGTKNSIARLEQLGLLEEAARQLQDPSCHRYTKKEAVFTDDFLFSNYSSVVIPYSDLLWLYCAKTSRPSIFVPHHRYHVNGLFAGTAELEPRDIFGTGFDEEFQQELDEIIAFIVSKNPDILVGSELDKRFQYRALVEAHSK